MKKGKKLENVAWLDLSDIERLGEVKYLFNLEYDHHIACITTGKRVLLDNGTEQQGWLILDHSTKLSDVRLYSSLLRDRSEVREFTDFFKTISM